MMRLLLCSALLWFAGFSMLAAGPPPSVQVTFRVDMSYVEVSEEGVFLSISVLGWDPLPMDQITGEVWEATVEIPINYEVLWKFMNGPGGFEASGTMSDCTIDSGIGGANRTIVTGTENQVLPTVCFGYCAGCEVVSSEAEQVQPRAEVRFFPNPASAELTLNFDFSKNTDLQLRMTDQRGRLVWQKKLTVAGQGQTTFDVSELPAGLYHFRTTADGRHSSQRLVLNTHGR